MPYILTGNKNVRSKPGISMVTQSSCIPMVDSPTGSILFPAVQFQQWPWGTPRLHSTPSLELVTRAWGQVIVCPRTSVSGPSFQSSDSCNLVLEPSDKFLLLCHADNKERKMINKVISLNHAEFFVWYDYHCDCEAAQPSG